MGAHPGWQLLLLLLLHPGSCLTTVGTMAEWGTDDLVGVGTRRWEKPPDTRLQIKKIKRYRTKQLLEEVVFKTFIIFPSEAQNMITLHVWKIM